jgi:hypothetical protein
MKVWATAALWMLAPALEASVLLAVPERGPGFAEDPRRFAELGAPGDRSRGVTGFAVDGKVPPIHWFFCTVYYIPRESGFTAEGGFDMTPDLRLRGKKLPRSFVRAVRMEGTGRLAKPAPRGENYICYLGNFRKAPLGNRNNVLTPRASAAVHRRNPLFGHGTPMRILDRAVWNCFGSTAFEAADTGGGLFPAQIDLYWGEDDPRSAWEIARPASCDIAVRWVVPVMVGR